MGLNNLKPADRSKFKKNQGIVVQSMGLRKLNHTVTLPDTPETRGMIFKVRHLVSVSE